MRGPNPDHICGLCDEFDVDQAAPECAAKGMGRCIGRTPESMLDPHVAWDGWPCVSFRLDYPNLRRKRQFVTAQRRAKEPVDADVATETVLS